jgi:hypothetical protein
MFALPRQSQARRLLPRFGALIERERALTELAMRRFGERLGRVRERTAGGREIEQLVESPSVVRHMATLDDEVVRPSVVSGFASILQEVHAESDWPPAARVADSGVLQLQNLLWQLKIAVARRKGSEVDRAFREYADTLSEG